MSKKDRLKAQKEKQDRLRKEEQNCGNKLYETVEVK